LGSRHLALPFIPVTPRPEWDLMKGKSRYAS
jgi:hypothetical protein